VTSYTEEEFTSWFHSHDVVNWAYDDHPAPLLEIIMDGDEAKLVNRKSFMGWEMAKCEFFRYPTAEEERFWVRMGSRHLQCYAVLNDKETADE